jgi:hypothetical protein
MCASIDRFIAECRERPRLAAEHIETIETALTRCFRATGTPKYLRLWTDIERCILRTGRSVQQRLEEMGRIADAFQEQVHDH